MVNGMESFIEKFRDYTDCYTVIGGAASDMQMALEILNALYLR